MVTQFLNLSDNQSISTPGQEGDLSLRCGLDLRKAELPVILVTTIAVNVLALIVMVRIRGSCDTTDHQLMSILNLNDLLTAAIYTLMWISGWASCDELLNIYTYCAVLGWLGSSLTVWSAGIIIIMTSCRYLSLVKPMFYRVRIIPRTVTQAAIAALGFCLLFFSVPFTRVTSPFIIYTDNHICATDFSPGKGGVGQRVFIGFIGAIGLLTVLHVIICNTIIICTLRQKVSVHPTGTITSVHQLQRPQGQDKRRIFGHVTLIVSVVYALCYAPFVIRLLVDTASNLDHQNSTVHSVTMSLLFLSPLLNPIIYGIFNKHFRRTLFSLCIFCEKCKRCSKRNRRCRATHLSREERNGLEHASNSRDLVCDTSGSDYLQVPGVQRSSAGGGHRCANSTFKLAQRSKSGMCTITRTNDFLRRDESPGSSSLSNGEPAITDETIETTDAPYCVQGSLPIRAPCQIFIIRNET